MVAGVGMTFRNRVVVITGGASGIGWALAQCFLEAEARVILLDLDQEALDGRLKEGHKTAALLTGHPCDVTSHEHVKDLARQIKDDYGRLDFWVNNAGIAQVGPYDSQDMDAVRQVLGVNLFGVIHGTNAALDVMKDQAEGSIINMASVAGHLPSPLLVTYCTSKHAVVGYTRALQDELKWSGSRVRAVLVSPGFVDTPLIRSEERHWIPQWLQKKFATPEKVAAEVMRGLERKELEIFPTFNGRVFMALGKVTPGMIRRTGVRILRSR